MKEMPWESGPAGAIGRRRFIGATAGTASLLLSSPLVERATAQGSNFELVFGAENQDRIRDLFSGSNRLRRRVALTYPIFDKPSDLIVNVSDLSGLELYMLFSGRLDESGIENLIRLRQSGALIYLGAPYTFPHCFWVDGLGGLFTSVTLEHDLRIDSGEIGFYIPRMSTSLLDSILVKFLISDFSSEIDGWMQHSIRRRSERSELPSTPNRAWLKPNALVATCDGVQTSPIGT